MSSWHGLSLLWCRWNCWDVIEVDEAGCYFVAVIGGKLRMVSGNGDSNGASLWHRLHWRRGRMVVVVVVG